MRKFNFVYVVLFVGMTGIISAGCSSMSKTQKGVAIGAGAGGAVGAGVGKVAGNTALGAIIGATVGGVTGGIIGRKMDKEAEELAKIEGAEVKRVGEGINVTFESGVLFAVNQSDLTAAAQSNIRNLAQVFKKHPDSYILIEGHTDASGSDALNMTLSEKRSKSVAAYLQAQGVAANRIKTAWYGENQPIASNETDEGKAKNRRVEFAIYANEKMIQDAKREAGQ